ncbi:MAG TPA: hypothetical protein VNA21_06515 [Steroidobacteraceae bacterium]|nr:hypothetical protein [Steroidobacteraceae bacterium]
MYGSGFLSSLLKPHDSRRSGSSIDGSAAPRESSIRRSRFDAVLAAALLGVTVTLAGAVPEGDGSVVALGRLLRLRALLEALREALPRDDRAPDFLAIRYLPR